MTMRVTNHPILQDKQQKKEITIYFNGEKFKALEGDTIASALLSNKIRNLRKHEESGSGRGIYCNIGHCYECRVKIRQQQIVRACLTPVRDGMVISSDLVDKRGDIHD